CLNGRTIVERLNVNGAVEFHGGSKYCGPAGTPQSNGSGIKTAGTSAEISGSCAHRTIPLPGPPACGPRVLGTLVQRSPDVEFWNDGRCNRKGNTNPQRRCD